MVQLNNLDIRQIAGSLSGELHHQHRPDGEVRCHEHVGAVQLAQRVEIEARGPDDDMDAGLGRRAGRRS